MQKSSSQAPMSKTLIVILCLIIGGLLYLLAPILMPFVAGALIAYLCDPLINRIRRFGLSRNWAVTIVFSLLMLSILLFIVILIPVLQKQVAALSVAVPKILEWVQDKALPWIVVHLGLNGTSATDIKAMVTQNLMKTGGGTVSWAFLTVIHSGKALAEIMINLILIPVVTFYLMRDWDILLSKIRGTLPPNMKPTIVKLAKECDVVLSAFFRGQLIVMLLLGLYYAVSLSIMGLQIGVAIGIIVGLISIVPYLGLIVGIVIASIAALVQFGTLSSVLLVCLIFAIGHGVENFFLTPILIGDRIGLHPVVVIFAILAGGALFGFFGVLLALPVAAVIMVLLRHLHHYYYARVSHSHTG